MREVVLEGTVELRALIRSGWRAGLGHTERRQVGQCGGHRPIMPSVARRTGGPRRETGQAGLIPPEPEVQRRVRAEERGTRPERNRRLRRD
ncbi:hypothetical protein GCM10017772_00570 [Promicromonospora soli]|uniref:Uncharacterized protein n=1 Tax=Promicromonospora soli TaxID=2035533 RepID=A0A919KLH6_9MICO|nr:hypothetical protein GCM10017772_00570 [Promicromonospora soli]